MPVSRGHLFLMESVMTISACVFRRWISTSALAVATSIVAVPSASLAQTIRSTLTGTVTDPNSAVVPATVTATNVATNIESTTKTNNEGLVHLHRARSRRIR